MRYSIVVFVFFQCLASNYLFGQAAPDSCEVLLKRLETLGKSQDIGGMMQTIESAAKSCREEFGEISKNYAEVLSYRAVFNNALFGIKLSFQRMMWNTVPGTVMSAACIFYWGIWIVQCCTMTQPLSLDKTQPVSKMRRMQTD
jgi:hypothetical protein